MFLQFFKRSFHFPGNLIQFVSKRSKSPMIAAQKYANLSKCIKDIAILIILSTILRGTYPLSGGFKTKTVRKSVSCVKTKNIPHFPVNFVERRNHSILMNHLDQASVNLIEL